MKKILLFAAVATMFAACSNDPTEGSTTNKPIDKFYATLADNDSRVQLDNESHTVWTAGDRVSVFNRTKGNECWQFDGATGNTSGELTKENGVAGDKFDEIVAIYPYNAEHEIDNDIVFVHIPYVQQYAKDSFGEGGNIMFATSNNQNLTFHHVFGWIKLELTGDYTVKSITLRGRNYELMPGGVAAVADDFSLDFYTAPRFTATLDCGDGVQLSSTPTSFYIAVVPQTFANGIDIEVRTDGGGYVQSIDNAVSVARNHIVPVKTPGKQSESVITYTTSDGNAISIDPDNFSLPILSHTYNNGLGVIVFDGKVTSIDDYTFARMTTLTGVTIPDSVTSIGMSAFDGCTSLTDVIIPDGVTSIGNNAFFGCTGLTDIVIPDSVTSIGSLAFENCTGLARIVIPDSVTEIGTYAFLRCTGKLYVNCNIPDGTIKDSYLYGAFVFCKFNEIIIGDGVQSIGDYAFYGCDSMTSVTIGNSVTTIGICAFYCCSALTTVTIPNSVTSIGESVFCGCKSLKGFYGKFASEDSRCLIRDGILEHFAPAGLTEYTIPDGVRSIGKWAFTGCAGLASITIPNSVTSILIGAFYYCTGLESIVIPNSVTEIGRSAFEGCTGKLYVNCSIPDWINNNGSVSGPFISSAFTDIIIGNGVKTIGEGAFAWCEALINVTIPDSITSIRNNAFSGCIGLKSITIPNSVTSIGSYVFYGCTALVSVYCQPATPPTFGEKVFYNNPSDAQIYVPRASVEAYKAADGWSDYAAKIVGYDF